MLTVTEATVKDGAIKCIVEADEADTVSFGGRVVKLDFGTISAIDWTEVKLKKGKTDVSLTIMRWDQLPAGDYAFFLNTIFNTTSPALSDAGPFEFTKGLS